MTAVEVAAGAAAALQGGNGNGQTVCVTGAAGYIASWLVKLLLEKGYTVKGTVTNPEDPKNVHLKALDGATERLILCKADIRDYDAICRAVDGCHGVFHIVPPVTDDPEQMVEPAVRGTKYVINAAAEAGTVRRMVLTSSIGAMIMNPKRGADVVVDESCWTDAAFAKKTKNWYYHGKAVVELAAWEAARQRVDLVVVNPGLVIGPLLQPTVNASITHFLKYLNGSASKFTNAVQAYVDVRDVADAHLRVFEVPTAFGRHFCAEGVLHREHVVGILTKRFPEYSHKKRTLFPGYPVPSKCSDEVYPWKQPYKMSNKKLRDLGLVFRPVSQSLYETVKDLQEKGHL